MVCIDCDHMENALNKLSKMVSGKMRGISFLVGQALGSDSVVPQKQVNDSIKKYRERRGL